MGCCMSTSGWFEDAKPSGQHFWITRKNRAKAILAAEAKHDEQLLLLSGRLWRNSSSNIASLYSQQGKKGINQDTMLLWQEFGLRRDTIFCGVFDGHGPYGHSVAQRVRDSLPSKLLYYFQAIVTSESNEKARSWKRRGRLDTSAGAENEKLDMFSCWKAAHLQACKTMDRELRLHPSINCFCSGSTAVTILKQGKHLIIANIGDSRAVMASKADDNSITAVQLTVDLKPNLPGEAERIRQCKGRVFALNDEPDVHRVWLPHFNSPGLAMARAFGDFCLKDFGVIAIPEISYMHISERDQFIILATDGVWDVLTNQEAVEIVYASASRRTAAKDLVAGAVQAWKMKYPSSKVDDCAVVCLYVDDTDLQVQKANHDNEGDLRHAKQPSPSIHSDDTISNAFESAERKIVADNLGTETINDNLSNGISAEGQEWSALDGVTRANSLINLPRVVPAVNNGLTFKRRH